MNDFTKEELNILYLFIDGTDWSDYEKIDDMFALKDKLVDIQVKIKVILDAYCDHEWDGILTSQSPNMGKCKKCSTECFIFLKGD